MLKIYDDTELGWKSLLVQLGLLAVCISMSIFDKRFVLVTFAIVAVTCLFNKYLSVYCHLFFILPFTVIFKLSPESSSFFAYLELIVALSLIIRLKVRLYCLIPIGIYTLLGLLNNPIIWIKLMAGWVLLIYFVKSANTNWVKYICLSCAFGLILSSAWGLIKFDLPQLALYVESNSENMLGERIERFSGLYYDPNYYSATVVMILYMILYFGASNIIDKKIAFPIAAALLYFGALSYSKMFVLAVLLVLIIQLNNMIKYAKRKGIVLLLIAIASFIVLPLFLESNFLANFINRFYTRDFSSGRFDLITSYLSHIFSHLDVLTFGKGLGGELHGTHAPHNTFIEALYFLGLIGSTIYIITLYNIFSSRKLISFRTPQNYSLFLIFCFLLGSLGMLVMNDFVFFLMLLWYSFNINYKQVH